jgi:hypothetical protein
LRYVPFDSMRVRGFCVRNMTARVCL